MKKYILSFIYYLSGLIPKKKNLVVFGAWSGDRISDNPKAIFDELKYYDNYKCVWISKKATMDTYDFELEKDNSSLFIKRNSLKSVYYMSRARYIYVSHSYRDILPINLAKNGISIQLWHGFPIKKIVADVVDDPGNKKNYYERYDWFLSSSPLEDQRIMTAFRNWGINENNILKVGNPRNDILVKSSQRKNIKDKLLNQLCIPKDATVILYMPTFRDKTNKSFSFNDIDSAYQDELAKNNIYIIEKQHYVYRKQNLGSKRKLDNIINISELIDTQELLILGDVLVTDYSSIYLDFIIQEKPVIHFLYDGVEYIEKNREIYGDFDKESAGPIFHKYEEIIDFLILNKGDFFYKEKNKEVFELTNKYNVKNNSLKIISDVMENNINE